jgi:hypothetical protein
MSGCKLEGRHAALLAGSTASSCEKGANGSLGPKVTGAAYALASDARSDTHGAKCKG